MNVVNSSVVHECTCVCVFQSHENLLVGDLSSSRPDSVDRRDTGMSTEWSSCHECLVVKCGQVIKRLDIDW